MVEQQKARVVKDDGVSGNYTGRKLIDELKRQGAALLTTGAGWMIVETPNINAEDGIKKRQRVKWKLQRGALYVYEAEFMIYDIKGFDFVMGKRWMHNINQWYQIDDDSNEIWIADNLCEEREDGRVHYLPGLRPLDIDEGIVEQAKFIGIHSIRKGELKNVSACLMKWVFLVKVHHRGDGSTLQTDELLGEFQEMLTEFQGLLDEPTFPNVQNGRQADFEIKMNPNGKILFRSPYWISLWEEAELRRQIDKAICCGRIQPSWSNFGSPVIFMPKPDHTLCMSINDRAVNAITVKDRYPLIHIENLLNSTYGSCWFRK